MDARMLDSSPQVTSPPRLTEITVLKSEGGGGCISC